MNTDLLHDLTRAFADAAVGLDPEARVPTCPEWPLRVLVGHIGQEHRWAAEIVRTGAASGIPDPRDAQPGSDWKQWLAEGAELLAEAVAKACDATVWTFIGPQPASFWLRRMVNDTAVHYADAAIAAGHRCDIPDEVAVDAIEEGLEFLANPVAETIKPAVAELRGAGETIRIQPGGHPGWLITRSPEGVRWRHGAAAADVTVNGTAQDLLLVFFGRLPIDDVSVSGNRALMTHWLAHSGF
ncbi:MAG: maleylpyruvate isomerase family mycothiol-dependent enzyme [Kibdelosporangium sp.]